LQEKNANVADQPKKENNGVDAKRAFRIGVIVNGCNYEDVKYYNEQFKKINRMYKDKIDLVFFGYKPEEDILDALDGVNFEYVKPVSIVHYFKQLNSLNIDLLLIPMIKSLFNTTSENYNKYLEASVLRIPIIAPDVYPYNKIIKDKINGFIFGEREQFVPYLKNLLLTELGLIRLCANHANKDVVEKFNYSQNNMQIISNLFEKDDVDEDYENEEEEDNGDDGESENENNNDGQE